MNEIRGRLREIAAKAREEKRELTDAEREEVRALERELGWLEIETRAAGETTPATRTVGKWTAAAAYLRTVDRQTEVQLREGEEPAPAETADATSMTTADAADGALQPLTVGDIIWPVNEGLIWNLIGIRIPTGLTGKYEWPVVSDDSEASFAGELEEGVETKIDLDSIAVVQQRLHTGVSASRESIFNSAGRVETVIRTTMPLRMVRAINHVLFSTEKLEKSKIQGPLVGLKASTLSSFGAKTFKELNTVKAGLLGKGYSSTGMVWVMTEETKAMLEATPKDAGSGIMCVENGRLCGLPIYCTHYIGDHIALGDWRFQVCGQCGTPSFIVDPYTGAAKDKIKFNVNTYYATATLDEKAFALCKVPTV